MAFTEAMESTHSGFLLHSCRWRHFTIDDIPYLNALVIMWMLGAVIATINDNRTLSQLF
jgi:hypothetical protein